MGGIGSRGDTPAALPTGVVVDREPQGLRPAGRVIVKVRAIGTDPADSLVYASVARLAAAERGKSVGRPVVSGRGLLLCLMYGNVEKGQQRRRREADRTGPEMVVAASGAQLVSAKQCRAESVRTVTGGRVAPAGPVSVAVKVCGPAVDT